MNKEITKECGGCEVTIAFRKRAEPIKDQVLWLILQSFKERMEDRMKTLAEP